MNIPYVEFRTKPALLTYHDLGLNYVSNFQVKNLHHQKCFRSGFSKIFESTKPDPRNNISAISFK